MYKIKILTRNKINLDSLVFLYYNIFNLQRKKKLKFVEI